MSQKIERRKKGRQERREGDRDVPARDTSPRLPLGLPGYRVRIFYTEPEFQARNPQCPREFSISRDYPGARSPQEALRQAVEFFDFCAENSSVGWRRIICSMVVEPR